MLLDDVFGMSADALARLLRGIVDQRPLTIGPRGKALLHGVDHRLTVVQTGMMKVVEQDRYTRVLVNVEAILYGE